LNILLGTNAGLDTIDGWIDAVNKEFGLEALTPACQRYMRAVKDQCIFIFEPEFEAVLTIDCDMWCRREMHIVSYYVKKECRNIRVFLKLQRKFEELARAFDCKYLVQGSHLGDRLFKYLEHNGYKVATMKKEIS
jgi:hypothetical protein